MFDVLIKEFESTQKVKFDKHTMDPLLLRSYAIHLEMRLLFPRFVPLDWKEEGDDTWVAQGLHEILQIDRDAVDDGWYYAQRNNINDDDCDGDDFATLEEAKAYLENLHAKDMERAMEFVQWPILL
jgi:hypothetical protein